MIWMYRNPKQQAKSQRIFSGKPRQWVAPRAKYIRKVESVVPDKLASVVPLLRISFDDMVSSPKDVGIDLERWLGREVNMSSVKVRSPRPGLYSAGELEKAS